MHNFIPRKVEQGMSGNDELVIARQLHAILVTVIPVSQNITNLHYTLMINLQYLPYCTRHRV